MPHIPNELVYLLLLLPFLVRVWNWWNDRGGKQ